MASKYSVHVAFIDGTSDEFICDEVEPSDIADEPAVALCWESGRQVLIASRRIQRIDVEPITR